MKFAVIGACLFALASCGQDPAPDFVDQSAAEIEAAAIAAMRNLDSVTMTAEALTGSSRIAFAVSVSSNGECTGDLDAEGGHVELRVRGDNAFAKLDEGFWKFSTGIDDPQQFNQLMSQVRDKWIPAEETLTALCDFDQVLERLNKIQPADAKKGPVSEVAGVEAIALIHASQEGGNYTTWVSTDHEHYLVKLEATDGTSGTAQFSDFDEAIDVDLPADSEIFYPANTEHSP